MTTTGTTARTTVAPPLYHSQGPLPRVQTARDHYHGTDSHGHHYSGDYSHGHHYSGGLQPRTPPGRCTRVPPLVRTVPRYPITRAPSPPPPTTPCTMSASQDRCTAPCHHQECQFSEKWCQTGAVNNHGQCTNGNPVHARRDCQTKPGYKTGFSYQTRK